MKRDLPLAERLDRSPNEFITDIIARPIGKSLSCLLGLGIWLLIGWLCWATVSEICHWVEYRPRITGIAGIKFGCKPPKWEDVGGFDGFDQPVTYETPIGNKVYRIVLRSSRNEYSEVKWIIQRITGISPDERSSFQRNETFLCSVFKDPNSSRSIKVEYREHIKERMVGFDVFRHAEITREEYTLIEAVDEELRKKANSEALKEKLRRAR